MAINPLTQNDAASIAGQAAAVSNNQAQPAAKESAPAKTQTATTDTVQISMSARAMLQETEDNAAKNTGQAGQVDRQAVQKEAAVQIQQQGSNPPSPLNPK